MVFDGEPSNGLPLLEECTWSRMTLTFDLLTSELIGSSVPKRTKVVIWRNSHKRLMRYRVNKLLVCDHGRTHGQPQNRMHLAQF